MLVWKLWSMIWLLCLHSTLQSEMDNEDLNVRHNEIIQAFKTYTYFFYFCL